MIDSLRLQLNQIKIKEILKPLHEKRLVTKETPIFEIINICSEQNTTSNIYVLDENQTTCGYISIDMIKDFLFPQSSLNGPRGEKLLDNEKLNWFKTETAGEIMEKIEISITTEEFLFQAINKLSMNNMNEIAVTNENGCIEGTVSYLDAIKYSNNCLLTRGLK